MERIEITGEIPGRLISAPGGQLVIPLVFQLIGETMTKLIGNEKHDLVFQRETSIIGLFLHHALQQADQQIGYFPHQRVIRCLIKDKDIEGWRDGTLEFLSLLRNETNPLDPQRTFTDDTRSAKIQ